MSITGTSKPKTANDSNNGAAVLAGGKAGQHEAREYAGGKVK